MSATGKTDVDRARYAKTVGTKIARLIAMKEAEGDKCTYMDVALAAGYSSNSMISQIISGDKLPSISRLQKIAGYFDLPANYLLDDVDYTVEDLRLITATHKMIKNKKSDPLYAAALRMHNIK